MEHSITKLMGHGDGSFVTLAVELLGAVLVGLHTGVAHCAAAHQRTVGVVVVDLLERALPIDHGSHIALIVLDMVVPLPVSPVAVVAHDALQNAVTVDVAAAVVAHHQGGLGRDIDDGVMPS